MKDGLARLTPVVMLIFFASCPECNRTANGVGTPEIVDVGRGDADGSESDQFDLGGPDTSDTSLDGLDADSAFPPEKVLQWHAFGESHVMLSIDSSVLLGNATGVYWDEWVDRYEVTLRRVGGAEETILSGNVGNPSWIAWPQRLTEVVAFAASPDETVDLCLLLYGPDDSVFSSGCQERTLVPGTYGQVLWQLSANSCHTEPDMTCFPPQMGTSDPRRTPDSNTPTLFFAFTLGEHAGVPLPGTVVSLAFAPPLTCDAALAWFRRNVIDDPTIVFRSCYEPAEGMFEWTGASVELPTAAAAMGMFNEILSLPEGVPAASVWESVWAQHVPADGLLVGATYGQLGTAQAQYPCEQWSCD